jgi:SAM-dependent methyltransferase
VTESGRWTPFRCPSCKQPLRLVRAEPWRCVACGQRVRTVHGLPSFVRDPLLLAELEHYEGEYATPSGHGPTDPAILGQLWHDNPYSPFDEWMLDAMGDLRDRVVVVLGNGRATKELHLLAHRPRALVISDLSVNAVRALCEEFREHRGREDLFYAAIDGQDLPFEDASVDVVYGYAFVHHLPDLQRFLAEAARVLKPGGRAVFSDNAYSPLWQKAKHGWLRSAMRLAHRRNPISDEDVRYTLAGGFIPVDLEAMIGAVGCRAWFRPTGVVHYLATRMSQIFAKESSRLDLGRRNWRAGTRLEWPYRPILEGLLRIDAWLERFAFVRANRMRLIWGFEKSATSRATGSDPTAGPYRSDMTADQTAGA